MMNFISAAADFLYGAVAGAWSLATTNFKGLFFWVLILLVVAAIANGCFKKDEATGEIVFCPDGFSLPFISVRKNENGNLAFSFVNPFRKDERKKRGKKLLKNLKGVLKKHRWDSSDGELRSQIWDLVDEYFD